jgi:serine/threonine protein kinase
MWQAEWQVVENHEQRTGGQATVLKVTRRSDGALGALKQLHPQHLSSTERRFRMQQEANALIALSGKGVPQLLASNVESWMERGEPLYIVMEWVDGPTLADACSKKKFSIEQALSVALAVLYTIESCHELPLYHRDLKPDNVILLGGSYENPVLVDFGMAWARPDEEQTRGYDTPVGQELGNRFLRLPEFAPGRDAHDPRSDLSMVVGLLFYMLTNLAPRALDDGRGRMPHEAFEDSFPEAVRQDTRWVRLRRIFNIGFQGSLDLRFQNVEQLRSRLLNLEPPEGSNEEQKLQEELAAIADVMNSAGARSVAVGATIISLAAERFMTTFRRAFSFLRDRDFAKALDVIDCAISTTPGSTWAKVRRAHALMLLGREDEARTLYRRYRGVKVDPESSGESIILQDFAAMRQAGLAHPLMDEIEQVFAEAG